MTSDFVKLLRAEQDLRSDVSKAETDTGLVKGHVYWEPGSAGHSLKWTKISKAVPADLSLSAYLIWTAVRQLVEPDRSLAWEDEKSSQALASEFSSNPRAIVARSYADEKTGLVNELVSAAAETLLKQLSKRSGRNVGLANKIGRYLTTKSGSSIEITKATLENSSGAFFAAISNAIDEDLANVTSIVEKTHVSLDLATASTLAAARTLISLLKNAEVEKWLNNARQSSALASLPALPYSSLLEHYDRFCNELREHHPDHAIQKLTEHPSRILSEDTSVIDEVQPDIRNPASFEDTLLSELENRIHKRECARIPINENFELFADPVDGRILGPIGEGTSAVVFFGRRRGTVYGGGDQVGLAIRVPKFSTGNVIQNFENAETCYFEHLQAGAIPPLKSLAVPKEHGCLHKIIRVDEIRSMDISSISEGQSQSPTEMFVALNMSPGSPARIGIVTPTFIWPIGLKNALKELGSSAYAAIEKHLLLSRKQHASNANFAVTSDKLMMPTIAVYHDSRRDEAAVAALGSERSVSSAKIRHEKSPSLETLVDRTTIEHVFAVEKSSGWSFGLPYMASDWLATDLHRLMVGLVSTAREAKVSASEPETLLERVRQLSLAEWFEICSHLSEGLLAIHRVGKSDVRDGTHGNTKPEVKDRSHGDTRPANIMFMRGARPQECQWIDVGLGSVGARERRLGQSRRTSIFYSWERTEHASEENDQVQLIRQVKGDTKRYFLSFLFRDDNLKRAKPVSLKGQRSGTGGKLSLLSPGDRLVLGGEFVFLVKDLSDEFVEVSKVWEIASAQIPIEKELDEIFANREHKTISEYKILWRWGLASDIYGMGMIILFMFYMRGLYGILRSDAGASISSVDIEEGFGSLVGAIRTDGFLAAFLRSLNVSPEGEGGSVPLPEGAVHFRAKSDLFGLDAEVVHFVRAAQTNGAGSSVDSKVKKLTEIVDELGVFAPGLQILYYGVNSNPAVFTLLIYVVMACIWRRDEIDRLGNLVVSPNEKVVFETYCHSRSGEAESDLESGARLSHDLRIISRHLGASPNEENAFNSALPIVEAEGWSKNFAGNVYLVLEKLRTQNRSLRNSFDTFSSNVRSAAEEYRTLVIEELKGPRVFGRESSTKLAAAFSKLNDALSPPNIEPTLDGLHTGPLGKSVSGDRKSASTRGEDADAGPGGTGRSG